MLDEIIDEIKTKLQDLINESNKNLEIETLSFSKQEKLSKKVNEFLSFFDKNGKYDFDLLESFLDYFYDENIFLEKINYRELYQIRQELSNTFPDRISRIDDTFETLIEGLKKYTNSSVVKYKKTRKRIGAITEAKNKYEKFLTILDKVINNEFLSENEIETLSELSNILNQADMLNENLVEIYKFIVENNYNIMKNIIMKNQQNLERERLSKKIEAKRASEENKNYKNKTQKSKPQENTTQNIELTENVKKLLSEAEKIIHSCDIGNKEYIELVEGCSISEMFDYIYDFNNAGDNIALILNDIVIPKVKDGSLENSEEVLRLCISKYDEFQKKNDVDYKLSASGRMDIKQEMERANKLLSLYKDNMDKTEYRPLVGFYYDLENQLKDFKYAIIDDEIFNSSEFSFLFQQLIAASDKLQSIIKSLSYDSSQYYDVQTEAQKLSKKFYEDSTNLIIFPDEVNVSEQIDEDDSLNMEDKKRILKGLEMLSKDESIFVSSRHKIKDDNPKYSDLRSYRISDYRIVYRTSKADSLEKIFGKKVNLVFVLKVGYGAGANKHKFYYKAKKSYDDSEKNINKIIDIMNSDNLQAINDLLNQQLYKMTEYIEQCGISNDKGNSHEIKGGSSDE